MFDLSETVVAVSSPPGGLRSIVRITGPETRAVCDRIFERAGARDEWRAGIHSGTVRIAESFAMPARLYLFLAPHSYTGEDLGEIHFDAGPVIVEALVEMLLTRGLRSAGPGEFTARAYLSGKLDLAQAEAVNEVISSSNRLQLDAAERLLSGRLIRAIEEIRTALLDVLSLIEAGLDFGGEEIEFIGADQAAERLEEIRRRLESLLARSIRCETLVDLPAVGIAGAPNAGKSSLLNALLGWDRSLTSAEARTTRDILSGLWKTDRFECVLFDCAGLLPAPENVLDRLAQHAAVEALQNCQVVLFCMDVTKPDWSEDLVVRGLIHPKNVIHAATKSDLPTQDALNERMAALTGILGVDMLPVSAKTGFGLEAVTARCGVALTSGGPIANGECAIRHLALTARHRQAVGEAIEAVRQAAAEVQQGNDEVAVLLSRAAHQAITGIEHQPIDEQVLDRIFARFCIGK